MSDYIERVLILEKTKLTKIIPKKKKQTYEQRLKYLNSIIVDEIMLENKFKALSYKFRTRSNIKKYFDQNKIVNKIFEEINKGELYFKVFVLLKTKHLNTDIIRFCILPFMKEKPCKIRKRLYYQFSESMDKLCEIFGLKYYL